METKSGFTKMTIQEFETWIKTQKVARTIFTIQEHHTFRPDYSNFKGNNHFEMQAGMKSHHMSNNHWSDIGQHFSTFPDGSILTGRSLESTPACIIGQNSNDICIENIGFFDKNKDVMTSAQKDTIVRMTAALCSRFNLPVNTNSIVYHHWFDMNTGERNNGTRNNKSCPGSDFFGGNKVQDCINNFLPLVSGVLTGTPVTNAPASVKKYVSVRADQLNVRVKPDPKSDKVSGNGPALMGAILRVYNEVNGWYKISASSEHWVMGKFTVDVKPATVNADTLNIRTGPGKSFSKSGSYLKGQEIFIEKEENGWCKINLEDKWVSKDFLSFK